MDTKAKRILIVEDEPVSRETIRLIMKNYGDCVVAEGGKDAVTFFKGALEKQAPFDLVTLDISMPDMDGKDVLKHMRESEKRLHIPPEKRARIVMLTSYADRNNLQESLKAGCDDYFLKPFNKQIIEEKLKNMELLK